MTLKDDMLHGGISVINNWKNWRFPDPLQTEAVFPNHSKLLTRFRYVSHVRSTKTKVNRWLITTPTGFETDFASIPKVFRSFISKMERNRWAAIPHDYLYSIKHEPRKEADLVLLEALEEVGVNWITRHAMYRAVRLGGWVAYR